MGLLILISCGVFNKASAARYRPINELAFDLPVDGGGMINYSRLYPVNKFLQVGFTAGGGVYEREFDLNVVGGPDFEAKTEATVFPFIGARASFNFRIVGLSLAYGVFYADTEFEAQQPGGPVFKGSEKAWGTAFYSPLLVIDFYNRDLDMVFGFGIGGYLGSSYPDLEAVSGNTRLVADESPLQSITFHIRTRWSSGRFGKRKDDDVF